MTQHSDDSGQTDADLASVGRQLRALRRRRGWSLQQLSERAGVSFGLISQLERGLGNPSFTAMHRIASALNVPLPTLLEGDRDAAVVRAEERALLPVPADEPPAQQVVRELLTPRSSALLQLIRSTLPPGFSNEGRPYRHLGTECVTVVSGRLLVVHGDTRCELGEGDSMTYGCSVPHWWANAASTPTVVLGAVTPFET
ncbi:helix-turn-helix domain-containing protein [Nocardioides acrostichi]|uniref:Helix-turn-helix domain-containing protein n=1 Tax=Nocardioides acrostichi TaxID=2784339 RepID=A0A930V038_9ACTN|nr:helix-turn-helix domain-containing protein [Nocardioides acrostichi]MBF4160774.1 helix-turn-helix domain-containing protein [Nocardioides acrostichi]